jgi:hypothetical protein
VQSEPPHASTPAPITDDDIPPPPRHAKPADFSSEVTDTRWLTTYDIARIRKTSRQAAWKWVNRMAKKYGAPFVVRVSGGGKFLVSVRGLEKIQADEAEAKWSPARLRAEIDLLRDKLRETNSRLNGIATEVGELRRMVTSRGGHTPHPSPQGIVNRG